MNTIVIKPVIAKAIIANLVSLIFWSCVAGQTVCRYCCTCL